jgi:hypothetical protein
MCAFTDSILGRARGGREARENRYLEMTGVQYVQCNF